MKIIVLAGGYSPERNVSLSSGTLIANALIQNGHKVLLADLYLGLEENYEVSYLTKDMEERYHFEIPEKEPDLLDLQKKVQKKEVLIGPRIIEACQNADLTFLALHGGVGENGKLQSVFDIYGIKYTGSSYEGCLLSMNKDLSKKLITLAGVKTADWKTYQLDSDELQNGLYLDFPCVMKPLSGGSSVGITIIENENDLKKAIELAQIYESEVLLERRIIGREFSVGILGDTVLPPIEIVSPNGFYDYANKYQVGSTMEICPANISTKLERELVENALKVHKILRLGYYSRIDFIVSENEEIWCLEANALPGMTPNSLIPQEAKSIGIEFDEVCEMIVQAYSK